jgi:hypothetical protein
MLLEKHLNVTKHGIKKARKELEMKLRSFYQDTVDKTVIEPKTRSREKILFGSKEGTAIGIMVRQMMQFKSFPLAVLMQRVQSDVFLRTGKRATLKEGLKEYRAWGPAMASLMFQSTVMGYVAMSLKDLAKGNVPRDPLEDPARVAAAAFMQGGAAGILGDFLFAETNRYGQGLTSTVAGPTAGMFENAYSIIKGKDDYGSDQWFGNSIRLAYNNTPFANLFYTKAVIDYFFMDRVMNELRPGTMQRRAANKKRDTGQEKLYIQTEGF